MNQFLPGVLQRHARWPTLAAVPLVSHAIEEPKFEVIRKLDTVELRQVPTSQWATIHDSGTGPYANDDEHLGKLQAALAAADVAIHGQPVRARYKGPMTPWFMRRNEIWLALR